MRIHEVAHLSDAQIGSAVGAAPSTVRDWFARRSSPTGKRAERVAELAEIVDRLARVMEPDYIPVWLSRPIEALDDRKPLELIARGRVRQVARVISELEFTRRRLRSGPLALDVDAVDPAGTWLRHIPYGAIRAFGRSRPATTAGSAATSSTPFTSQTMRRRRSGRSGIATLPSVGFPRCGSSPGTCGVPACRAWRWPICARRTVARVGLALPIPGRSGMAPVSGGRRGALEGGLVTGSWRPARHGETASCSACSSRIRGVLPAPPFGDRGSWRSRRCRRPGMRT